MKNINFEKALFRCSSLGKIVSKSGKFTDTIKSYLDQYYTEKTYGVEKEINSKYFEKGKACEGLGIKLLNETLFKKDFLGHVQVEIENEFIKGKPDIVKRDFVIDVKNAYDCFTFEKRELSWENEWQLKGYMYLTNKTKSFIFHCLIDMPDFLLDDEINKLFWSGKFQDRNSSIFLDAVAELTKKYQYSNMSFEDRFKIYEVELTEYDIEVIQKSVMLSRQYLIQKQQTRNVQKMINIHYEHHGFEKVKEALIEKI